MTTAPASGKVRRDSNSPAIEPIEGYGLVHVFFTSAARYKPEAVFYDAELLAIVEMRPVFNSANKPAYFASGLVPAGSHVFWSKDRYGIAAAEMNVDSNGTYYLNADSKSRGQWTDQRLDLNAFERVVPTPKGMKWAEKISGDYYQQARWWARCRPVLLEVIHSAPSRLNGTDPPTQAQAYSARLLAIKNTGLRSTLSSAVVSEMVILAAFTLDGNPECSDYRVLDAGDLYHGGEGGGFDAVRGTDGSALTVPLVGVAADDTLHVSLGLYMTDVPGAPRLLSRPTGQFELSKQTWKIECDPEPCAESTTISVGSPQGGETLVQLELTREAKPVTQPF